MKIWKICHSCGGDLKDPPKGTDAGNRCLAPNSHSRPDREHVWLWLDNKFVLRGPKEAT